LILQKRKALITALQGKEAVLEPTRGEGDSPFHTGKGNKSVRWGVASKKKEGVLHQTSLKRRVSGGGGKDFCQRERGKCFGVVGRRDLTARGRGGFATRMEGFQFLRGSRKLNYRRRGGKMFIGRARRGKRTTPVCPVSFSSDRGKQSEGGGERPFIALNQ